MHNIEIVMLFSLALLAKEKQPNIEIANQLIIFRDTSLAPCSQTRNRSVVESDN
jgi:hypothetical protein